MVDFQTKFRLYSYGYTSPISYNNGLVRADISKMATQCAQHTVVHDCRTDVAQRISDPSLWEKSVLAHGVRRSAAATAALHKVDSSGRPVRNTLMRYLYTSGKRGKDLGSFQYPRGVAIGSNSDIYVADTTNARVQQFNPCGIAKISFGDDSQAPAETRLQEPVSVTVLADGDVAVADRKLRCVKIYDEEGYFRRSIDDFSSAPIYVTSDTFGHMIACTANGVLEIRSADGKLCHRIFLASLGMADEAVPIAGGSKPYVTLVDRRREVIACVTYDGQVALEFPMTSFAEGVTPHVTALSLTPKQQIVAADGLNHAIYLYSNKGTFKQTLLGPNDGLGAVQSCAVGEEGHVAVTEFSANGAHCLKVFAYKMCLCHIR